VGFSLLLVECDRLFPSKDVVPNQAQPVPADIKNIILDVPEKHIPHIADMTCKNDIKIEQTPYFTNSISQVFYFNTLNHNVPDNYYLFSRLTQD